MNIWLPIITNLIILGILIAGIFVGKKNGWKLELSKFVFVAASIVGLYFLSPIITKALFTIEFIQQLFIALPTITMVYAINSLVYLVSFLVVYTIISIIIKAIRNHLINKKVAIIKTKKVKGKKADKKALRKVKHENRKRIREQKKQLYKARTKKNKVFGALLGVLTAVLVAFMVMLPVKYAVKTIAEVQPELNQVVTAFEYTPYGQLDKITNINDIVNNLGE